MAIVVGLWGVYKSCIVWADSILVPFRYSRNSNTLTFQYLTQPALFMTIQSTLHTTPALPSSASLSSSQLKIHLSAYATNSKRTSSRVMLAQGGEARSFFSSAACGTTVASSHPHVYDWMASPPRGEHPPDFYQYTLYAGAHARRSMFPRARATGRDSRYDMASITKSVPVALLVLWAITQGLLGFETKIKNFFPSLQVLHGADPTIKDLLTYGVRFSLDHLRKPYDIGKDALLRELLNAEVTCSDFTYGNYPPILLALILEQVTGLSLPDLADRVLFRPLGMQCTFTPEARSQKSEETVGTTQYVCTEIPPGKSEPLEGVVHDEFTSASGLLGASGLFASVDDMLRVLQFLLHKGAINGEQIIREDLIAQLGMNQSTGGTPFGLGFGLWSEFAEGFDPMTEVVKNINPNYARGAFFKGGFTGGIIVCFPEIETGAVLLTNAVHPYRHASHQWLHRFRYSVIMQLLSGELPADASILWTSGLDKSHV